MKQSGLFLQTGRKNEIGKLMETFGNIILTVLLMFGILIIFLGGK
jgi:hypothetical protein